MFDRSPCSESRVRVTPRVLCNTSTSCFVHVLWHSPLLYQIDSRCSSEGIRDQQIGVIMRHNKIQRPFSDLYTAVACLFRALHAQCILGPANSKSLSSISILTRIINLNPFYFKAVRITQTDAARLNIIFLFISVVFVVKTKILSAHIHFCVTERSNKWVLVHWILSCHLSQNQIGNIKTNVVVHYEYLYISSGRIHSIRLWDKHSLIATMVARGLVLLQEHKLFWV